MVSAYLNSGLDTEQKASRNPSDPSANRMMKLTMFDGVSTFAGIEYEQLSMINTANGSNPGLLLALKPPIMVRKGLLLLKKQNC